MRNDSGGYILILIMLTIVLVLYGIYGFMVIMNTNMRINEMSEYDKLKTECELTLPRNQECEVQFVPVEDGNND